MFSRLKILLGFGISVEMLAERFYADRVRLNLRPATLKAYRHALGQARRLWTDCKAAAITPEDMRALGQRHGFYTARRVRAMFRWGIEERLLIVDPAEKIFPRRRDDEADIRYLSPAAAHRFLDAVRQKFRAAFGLALFSGIRPFELARLDWSAIHVSEKRIKIMPAVGKTGGRIIEGVPDILWEILAPLAQPAGPMIEIPARESKRPEDERRYDAMIRERARAARKAGVSLSPDVFRHTFATFFVAFTGNPGIVAKVLGHEDLKMLSAHYDGREIRANAMLYFREPARAMHRDS